MLNGLKCFDTNQSLRSLKASKERTRVVEKGYFFLSNAILQRNVKWLCELNTFLQLLKKKSRSIPVLLFALSKLQYSR